MSDQFKCQMKWTQEIEFTSEFEIDKEDIVDWMTETEKYTPDTEITGRIIEEYFRDCGDEVWLEYTDVEDDECSVIDNTIEDVTIVE